jgi:hypothetical protein
MKSSAGFNGVAGGMPELKAGLVCSSAETNSTAAEITGYKASADGSDGA